MTEKQFVSWLEGYLDASGESLGLEDIKTIKEKLQTVTTTVGFTPIVNPGPTIVPYTYPDTDTVGPNIVYCKTETS